MVARPRDLRRLCDAHALWALVGIRDRLFDVAVTDCADRVGTADAIRTAGRRLELDRDGRIMRAGIDAAIAAGLCGRNDRSSIGQRGHRVVAVRIENALREFHSREQHLGAVLVGRG